MVAGEATVRVQGLGLRTWRTRLRTLPESEAKEVPVGLTTRAGGPLAAKAGTRPNTMVPQTQHYLVPIDLTGGDPHIVPGTLAQAKIHCKWRTAAAWTWRKLSSAFDLGLLG